MTIDSQNSAKKTVEREDDEMDLMALLLALLRGWKTILFFAVLGESISELVGSEVSKAQTEAKLIRSRMILKSVVTLLHLRIKLSDPNIGAIDKITSNAIETQINSVEGVALDSDKGPMV